MSTEPLNTKPTLGSSTPAYSSTLSPLPLLPPSASNFHSDHTLGTGYVNGFHQPTTFASATSSMGSPAPFDHTPTQFIQQLELSDLMRNRHVSALFNRCMDAVDKVSKSVDIQQTHLSQLDQLRAENQLLRAQLQMVSRQKGMSEHAGPKNLEHDPAYPNQPASTVIAGGHDYSQQRSRSTTKLLAAGGSQRPDDCVSAVLWYKDNPKEHGLVKDGNESRPNMQVCIRTRKGATVMKSAYNTIRETVRFLVEERLPEDDPTVLRPPIDPKARHMTKGYSYYKKYYHLVYQELINDIEMNEPLVALCTNQWKAKMLVRQVIQTRVDTAAKKRKAEGTQSSSQGRAAKRLRIENKKTQRGSESSNSFDSDAHSNDGDNDNDKTQTEGQKKPAETSAQPTAPAASRQALTPLPPTASSLGICLGSRKRAVSVSFIEVTSDTAAALQRHINLITQLSLPACTDDLLKAMDAAPLFTSGDEPSATLCHLINDLEGADPNDSSLSEDEDNASFGHRQLSGRWRPALSSWKDIGSCTHGLHLLGAILRVCKVAWQICVERRIAVMAGGYLADMYFGEVIEAVWEHWKAAGGPLVKGKEPQTGELESAAPTARLQPKARPTVPLVDKSSADAAAAPSEVPSPDRLKKDIESCLKDDLAQWCGKNDLALPRSSKKPAYVTAIFDGFQTGAFDVESYKSIVSLISSKATRKAPTAK